MKRTRTIPVFFHNLTEYDCHLFVKRLPDSPGDVDCILRNEEKYVTFNKRVLVDTIVTDDEKEVNVYSCLMFADTMNFMRTSVEKLVRNLDKPSFEHTGKYFRGEELDLMLRKGVYPYEYMTGVQRFCEKSLPPKEEFASLLGAGVISESDTIALSHISEEDYRHAQRVFEAFGCENLADYTELYCKSDVLLLADVFESFIDVCLKKYKLDPSHYITAPALSWDAMLKMTDVKLKLLTDSDMHLFFEEGIRGGVSTITNRYAEANNPYIGKIRGKTLKEIMRELEVRPNVERQFSVEAVCEYFPNFSAQEIRDLRTKMKDEKVFNPDEAIVYLMYLDANNLYG